MPSPSGLAFQPIEIAPQTTTNTQWSEEERSVFTDYCLNLSPGQQRLYEILVSLQEGAVYSVTTIGKLAKAMGLENLMAAVKRLQLPLLRAISGFKI